MPETDHRTARSTSAGLLFLLTVGVAPAALAQTQSWDVPVSIGPISGTLQGTDSMSPQGMTGSFNYSGTGSQQGHTESLTDTDGWSVGRSGVNDTLGVGGSIAGQGATASGVDLDALSVTPRGGSLSYGMGGSVAGSGRSLSGEQLGAAAFGPTGTSYTEGSGSSLAGAGLATSQMQMGAGAASDRAPTVPAPATVRGAAMGSQAAPGPVPYTAGGAR